MKTDHTEDVEKRIKAISIEQLDCCSFYTPKEGSVINARLCVYCRYGKFEEDNKKGLCKYKRN